MSQSGKVLKEVGSVNVLSSSAEFLNGTTLGALNLSNEVSLITTTGSATATLADGVAGQKKTIVVGTHGGNLVLTPATFANGATLTFDAALEYASLVFDPAVGWVSVGGTATIA